MPVVFFLNRLRPNASAAGYERWIREVDYPTARALPPIKSYVVTKMAATLDDQPAPYDYIERVEITNIDDYRAALSDPSMEDFAKEWSSHIGESIAVFGEEIDS